VTSTPAIDGAPSLVSVAFDLGTVGYAVHEHFVSGTATAYAAVAPFEPDGRWNAEETSAAEFTTRCVVHSPRDPSHANGTVIFEWLNVTGGLDFPAVWMMSHRHLVRDGYTWVGVTAQIVGLEGGGMLPGLGLQQTAPDRYASLVHPGDEYSYDLFTQTARVVRSLLTEEYDIPVERMIAVGTSQSAFHLTTYINAVDPIAQYFDGFILQGRSGSGAPIEGWTIRSFDPAEAENQRARLDGRDRIREDARVPVMVFQSETDVFGRLAYLPARQPDSANFRLWEIAGAAHADTYVLRVAAVDSGSLPVDELGALMAMADATGLPTELPINSGPQAHFVLQRAIDAMHCWTQDGTPPPSAPRLEADNDGELVRDDLGIGCGGVRTPWVDVPAKIFSGIGQPGEMMTLFGTTQPLADEVRAARYPGGQGQYAEEFHAATQKAVDAGFLLAADADEIDALGALAW
jgi:hypothetical protein